MAMNSEELFKLAATAAPEDNRIMPPDRTYVKSTKTVSINEAISLMQKRRTDPSLRIEGGLDDNSDRVRKSYVDRQAKEKKAQEKTVLNQSILEGMNPGQNLLPEIGAQQNLPFIQKPAEQEIPVVLGEKVSGRVSTADLMNGINSLRATVSSSIMRLGVGLDTIIGTLEKTGSENTKKEEKSEKKDVLSEFKSGSHRVTFIINGMEFTVKCLKMMKDESTHSLVLAFSDDGESFFTPPMQSELGLKYDGLPEGGRLFYFGMCFSVKELGVKFLGFLFDESKDRTDMSETTNAI